MAPLDHHDVIRTRSSCNRQPVDPGLAEDTLFSELIRHELLQIPVCEQVLEFKEFLDLLRAFARNTACFVVALVEHYHQVLRYLGVIISKYF